MVKRKFDQTSKNFKISTKHMVDTFEFCSYFSGLKPNLRKSEIASIGVLKGVQVPPCGIRCIDLNNDT